MSMSAPRPMIGQKRRIFATDSAMLSGEYGERFIRASTVGLPL